MRCYLLAVCAASSIDRDTNNVTLFALVEDMLFQPFIPGQAIPVSTVACLLAAPEELQRTARFRLVWVRADGTETFSETHDVVLTHPRVRIRSVATVLPPTVGEYEVRFEWAWPDEEQWHREPIAYPVALGAVPAEG
jgi:hypothetical protein